MATPLKLPELGENVEKGTVIKVLVKVGDNIEKDQPVIEVETEKAALEVPSTMSGTIAAIEAKEGQEIHVGDVILTVEGDGKDTSATGKRKPEKADPTQIAPTVAGEETKTLKDRKPAPAARDAHVRREEVETVQAEVEAPEEAEPGEDVREAQPAEPAEPAPAWRPAAKTVSAAPSVRRFAREIGVDIYQVAAATEGGRVTQEDVKSFARILNTEAGPMPAAGVRTAIELPEFSRWGDVERQPVSTVRRRTAERMSAAWNTIPHVTQHDKADITELEKLRKRYGGRAEAAGRKLTATSFIVRVLASALQKFPQFNASFDPESNELVRKHYFNIGVAVDTDRGLLVPVIKGVERKNVLEIAVELADLAERARTRKVKLDEMQGACITVTNLGGIGGTAFTPIVNPPEVAILGVSRAQIEPVYLNGEFTPRTMLPVSLSYDHRVIDGADAARFTRWVCEALEQPFLLLLEG